MSGTTTKKPSAAGKKPSSCAKKPTTTTAKPSAPARKTAPSTQKAAPKKAAVKKTPPSNPGQEALNAKLAEEAKAGEAEEARRAEQVARWTGKVWHATMTELKDVMNHARQAGATPLLLDHTECKAVDTFYSYQSAQVIEGKKLVMQGRDAAGLAQVMSESKVLLLRAMARGYTLYLRMTNCAADVIESYRDPAKLPIEVWDQKEVTRVLGENLLDITDSPLKDVVSEDDCYEFDFCSGLFLVHKDFNVVVCSHFGLEDYEEFLTRALPLDKLQPISITNDD